MEFAERGFTGTVRLHPVPLTSALDRFTGVYAPEQTIHEPFPLPTGETAWTRVAWRADDRTLSLETIHTYPEERAGVRSMTCLYLPGPGGNNGTTRL
jgi:hypothetical protein